MLPWQIVMSVCWPSAELQAERVITHVWFSLSAVSATAGDARRNTSSFALAADETEFLELVFFYRHETDSEVERGGRRDF